jgi:hypothetical protein
MKQVRLKCAKCKGLKFIGDPYYAHGAYYVDVTCVVCADSKDIEVKQLEKFLKDLQRGHRAKKQTDN